MARASDKLRHDMQRVLGDLRTDLDRVELLAAALEAFSAPVPDYEPVFRHVTPAAHELARGDLRDKQACH